MPDADTLRDPPTEEDSLAGAPWEELAADGVLLRARAGTAAAHDLPRIAGRAELVLARAGKIVGCPVAPSPPLVVVLDQDHAHDESALADVEPKLGADEARRIHLCHRSDVPGHGLERALVKRLLFLEVGERAAMATVLVDGVTGLAAGDSERTRDAAPSDDDDATALSDLLHGLGRGEARGAYFQRATSFVSFLVERWGPAKLRAYALRFDPKRPDDASVAVYGMTTPLLEVEWRASLEKPRGASMGEIAGMTLGLLRPYLSGCAMIFGSFLVDLALSNGTPVILAKIVDQAIAHRDARLMVTLIATLLGLAVASSGAGLLRDFLYAGIGSRALGDLRQRMFAKLQTLSAGYYARTRVGDLLARFSSDLAATESVLTHALPVGVNSSLNVLVSVGLLFALDWRMASIALVGLPVGLVLPRALVKRAAAASYGRKRDEGRVATTVNESIGAQNVIKAFGLQAFMLGRFQEGAKDLVASSREVGVLAGLVERSAQIGVLAMNVAIIVTGAYFAFHDSLSIGALMAVLALFGNLKESLEGTISAVPQMLHASGSIVRVHELLTQPSEEDPPGAEPLPRLSGTIRLDGVTFGYTPREPTLRGASFTINAGENVAFVGPSGSGKSTVLSLVTRFYDPHAGTITFDGRDTRKATLASLRAQMGIVFQESILLNTTIRENIRLGRPDATDAEVVEAARAAEIHDVIGNLPKGYDTVVGERGGKLSGGQRQRIAIARALVRNPAILVLDEATSALDAASEAAINATLEKAAAGRTVLSVTHRLGSVVSADRIVVLDRGVVREQGKHAELLERGGLYKELWDKQSGCTVSDDGWHASVEPKRLRAVELLRPLDEEALAAIAGQFVTEICPAGHTLFEHGDLGDKFYIVVRGAVELLVPGFSGGTRRLKVMQDGDYFGEVALLHDVPRTATARTTQPSQLLVLPRSAFLSLLAKSPAMSAAVEAVARKRAQRTSLEASAVA